MTTNSRNIRVGFKKKGPYLFYDGTSILEVSEPGYNLGDVQIDENISYASIQITVPYITDEDANQQLEENELEWREQAENAYLKQHDGEPVVFNERTN